MQSGCPKNIWTVTYNTRKLRKPSSCCWNHHHHNKECETSVTIYVGLKTYSPIRSRTIIVYLFILGICTFDRIRASSTSIYRALRNSYARHELFLTRHLKKKCFVILVYQCRTNQNASLNLIHSHCHRTSIYLIQLPECKSQEECLDCFGYIDTGHKFKKLSP